VIAAAGFGLVATPLVLLPSAAHAAPVDITLLNINDFHGRIDANTVGFAGTVEKLRAENPSGTLFLSAGDNIGASLFASASADDNPTIDVLNALEAKASAVGNHEFDKGLSDLTGHVEPRANFEYLGANVYEKGTQTPALKEYATFDVNGVTVGVVGAVTQEVPSLVTPGGIATLDFGDPVDAVNRVAAQLSDGDEANGEADVIVAEYHAGASEGNNDPTPADPAALGEEFNNIVNNTDAQVDAIFTGHTHMAYAWDFPIPGATGKTRPVVQTGSYGERIGQIQLTVETDDMSISSYTAGNVGRLTVTDTSGNGRIEPAEQTAFDDEMVSTYGERVASVRTIVTDAVAAANEKGKVPVGTVSQDITTSWKSGDFVDGKFVSTVPTDRDDRMSESTLGNLVADALRDTLAPAQLGGAQIGVVNPGGLRNELLFEGTDIPDTNGDGVVTFAEANSVLPFVNNLWTVTLTGAQFKKVLEEQWQPEGADRPFLHLGLSDNVSTLLDESMPRGQRVRSVIVNGQPLNPTQKYVIGTFSFLAQGGDNFGTFKEGTNVKDSGLIDRDGWIDYLTAHQPVSPSFDRRQVFTAGLPARVRPGRTVAFTLDKLNLRSLGSPENTTVSARLKPADGTGPARNLGFFPVTDGAAEVSLKITAPVRPGYVVQLVAQPSGTIVTLPVLPVKATPKMRIVVKPERIRDDQTHPRFRVVLRAPGQVVKGRVKVRTHGDVKTMRLRDGRAVVRFAPYAKPGHKRVAVTYLGNDLNKRIKDVIQVRVRR
jgi:5'-nucleotidase